ncbi:MAG: SLC13 family permease, partial [Rhodospirillaceae bacterium]|nr:SLC13 family permease [Rhodospirillaceae bacterium]
EALTHDPEGLYPDLGDNAAVGEVPHIGFPEIDKSKSNANSDDTPNDTPWHGGERVLAEAMIPPTSLLIGQTLQKIGFRYKTKCIVLGVQRRSRMIRTRMTDIRLQAGDVLLLQGSPEAVRDLRLSSDVALIEWSAASLPAVHHAKPAALILLFVVVASASGALPIVVAALSGASAMVALGVMNIRQAARAVDSKILTMIPAALAMGVAMHETNGAHFIADAVVGAFSGASPVVILSVFFITMVGLTNIISSKAMAVLFTPIAVDLAHSLGASPTAFAVAVVFAANCSFASPIGYQTNLLVMAPGHYKFSDFARVGLPLILVVWAAFTLFVPWYYGI